MFTVWSRQYDAVSRPRVSGYLLFVLSISSLYSAHAVALAGMAGWADTQGSANNRSATRARYVPVSRSTEGQLRSLTEDQPSRSRSRHPLLMNDQGQRLPKLIVRVRFSSPALIVRSEEHTSELQSL